MKILQDRYPMGSLKGQKTPGRYIDGTLYENIKILGRKIVDDMTFLVIVTSSTLEVGTGKSVFVQQFAEAYLESVREQHNIDNRLDMTNIVFHPRDLIERSFKVPKYSVVILDEWEDSHYWSELGISLRQFFRKCRQLNLLMIAIIPNFFQLQIGYAISRSVCMVDVRFADDFDRGYFSFYNFQKKRELFIKGRKTMSYGIVQPNFTGRFADGYVVDKKEYLRVKLADASKYDKEEKKKESPEEVRKRIFCEVRKKLSKVTQEDLAEAFGIARYTAWRWEKDTKSLENSGIMPLMD